ncbi:hypothetical protein NEOKW01_0867 [Nematocida sp. AWRm80]|nr:hypothetical protein NEOKW01_0867 [Nematocida sp. AWRm80]
MKRLCGKRILQVHQNTTQFQEEVLSKDITDIKENNTISTIEDRTDTNFYYSHLPMEAEYKHRRELKEYDRIPWEYIPGLSGWLIYLLSKRIPLGIYQFTNQAPKGKKYKVRNKLDLTKLKYNISQLHLNNITSIRGTTTARIHTLVIKNTEITTSLWEIIKNTNTLVLENVILTEYKPEYLKGIQSLDILGSTVETIKHLILDTLKNKRRIRINNKEILVFYDEYKGCTFAIKYFDVLSVIKMISIIRVLYFYNLELSTGIINELSKHPITTIRLIKCKITPLKIYDILSNCKDTLKEITFTNTIVPVGVIEYIRSTGIQVQVNNE